MTKTPTAVLVAGGPLPDGAGERLLAQARTAAPLVGVDGGAGYLLRLGLRPDLVCGDFDSLAPADLQTLSRQGARIVPTPDQNYTDLDKALALVLGEGARRVRIWAATGGRLDHLVGALSTLVKYAHVPDSDIRLVDMVGETWCVPAKRLTTITGSDLPGRPLSLLALGPVDGITTTGVQWPLTNESLSPGVRDGTSNVITGDTVTIRAQSGNLLVMVHHGPELPAHSHRDRGHLL